MTGFCQCFSLYFANIPASRQTGQRPIILHASAQTTLKDKKKQEVTQVFESSDEVSSFLHIL